MDTIHSDSLALMRRRGGHWYVYENHDLGHHSIGHLKYLKCGKECTFKEPPRKLPDTKTEINWRYILVGEVDLKDGTVSSLIAE